VAALPLIDVSALLDPGGDHHSVAAEVDDACRRFGFFRIIGHRVPARQLADLDRLAREFFALPDDLKAEIAMSRGGAAWRGWFPLDGELTSGRPDHKEGIYFGTELGSDHPAVRARRPLHGANLFPATPPGLGAAVLAWIDAMTALGAVLLRAVALGLALPADWFARHVTAEPTVLFRIFRYPPGHDDGWGVAEHTDYGLLTILATDDNDGLEVHGPEGWIDVPSDPEIFVVNLGDMLDRMTEGRYRSTPHRVVNRTGRTRLSFPPSSTRRGTRCASRCPSRAARRPTMRRAAGTAPASGPGRAPTASTSRRRSPRCFRRSPARSAERRSDAEPATSVGKRERRRRGRRASPIRRSAAVG
jgi:isopenicillin N synthase-like dioxygenase